MFYLFYNLIFFIFFIPLALIYSIFSLLKGKRLNSVFKRFFYKREGENRIGIHFHGVSVGEIMSVEKLTRKISPKIKFGISVGTEAGYRTALKKYGAAEKILFSPFDFPFSVKSFINSVSPEMFIIVEAEFWYNLYYHLKKRGIPVWIVNFRVGDRKLYLKFKFYYRKVFELVDKFFVPTDDYIGFLRQFGVKEEKIIVSGNLKADISYTSIEEEEKNKIRKRLKLDLNKKVFIAGSISPEEFKKTVKILKKHKQEWVFIVAPRHIEKSKEIKMTAEKESLKTAMFTDIKSNNFDVLIIDTIGELFKIYSIGDLAFVGGSLVPLGGHNILEPIFHSVPTLTGKYYSNFKELVEDLKKKDGIRILTGEEELSDYLKTEKEKLAKIGENGKKALDIMKGAVSVILKELRKKGIEC